MISIEILPNHPLQVWAVHAMIKGISHPGKVCCLSFVLGTSLRGAHLPGENSSHWKEPLLCDTPCSPFSPILNDLGDFREEVLSLFRGTWTMGKGIYSIWETTFLHLLCTQQMFCGQALRRTKSVLHYEQIDLMKGSWKLVSVGRRNNIGKKGFLVQVTLI